MEEVVAAAAPEAVAQAVGELAPVKKSAPWLAVKILAKADSKAALKAELETSGLALHEVDIVRGNIKPKKVTF